MNNLAAAYRETGRSNLALPLFEETLKLNTAGLGPEHPATLNSMHNLAASYQDAGKLDKAVPLLEQTLQLRKARIGPDHPDTLVTMNNLAHAYRASGKPDLGMPLLEKALELTQAKLGPDHPETLATMFSLAMAYRLEKQLDRSIALFEECIKRMEAKFGRNHPETLLTVAYLGVNYKDAGRPRGAIPLLEEAHRAARQYPRLVFVVPHLRDAYARAGENGKLADLLLGQLTGARKALPRDSPQLAGLLAETGLVLLAQKKWAEAEPLLRESLAIRVQTQSDAWTTFNTQSMLGGALLGQKKYADAEPLLLKGYEGMKKHEKLIPPEGKMRLPEAIDRLIELYSATDRSAEAKMWQDERANYPSAHPKAHEKK
jgi:tetratricopeptide (TPR) repeat protein